MMTEMIQDVTDLGRTIDKTLSKPGEAERAAIREMVKSATDRGLALTGPDGLLKIMTKTVLTDNVGPVEIEVPRDRAGSFEPVIVAKRQRRLGDVDAVVLSLYSRGLTTGEISAHFAEVYGASIAKSVVSTITERVIEEMTEWSSRPLASHYVAVFVDAIVRHEALCDRVEVRDLHRLTVAAVG